MPRTALRKPSVLAISAALVLSSLTLVSGSAEAAIVCGEWDSAPFSAAPAFPAELRDVDARGASDAWAVGFLTSAPFTYSPVIYHFTGSQWGLSTAAFLASAHKLEAVDAASATSVWAVGERTLPGSLTGTYAEYWNGSVWTSSFPLNPDPVHSELRGVSALAANNVWAAGYEGTGFETMIQHWNGSSWKRVRSASPSATSSTLEDIDMVSNKVGFAVGNYQGGSGNKALVLTKVRRKWVAMKLPRLPDNVWLNGVDGVTADDVWAVGEIGTMSSSDPLILHFDGTKWTRVKTTAPQTYMGLQSVSATGKDVWAIGYQASGGPNEALIMHSRGRKWNIVTSPQPGTENSLAGVSVVKSHDAFAVGVRNSGSDSSLGLTYCPP